MSQDIFEAFFRSFPAEIDTEAIRKEWLACQSAYSIETRRLPLPVWARRGLPENGAQAWLSLRQALGQYQTARPYCIYLHLPFCSRKCGFCDCYSFRLNQRRDQHMERYLDALEQEMRLWSALGSLKSRPLSTVHFGGGTPTLLGVKRFTRLAQACRTLFPPTSQTEWALETTSTELTDEMAECLAALGFTRLHLGIQTLDDAIRRGIGRKETGAAVLQKISQALSRDWVVSVDLIFGLPGQTLPDLLEDIRCLAAAGVEGFSLYELQRSARNREFIARSGLAGRSRIEDYFMLQAASQLLSALGYRKTLFNHFARPRDTDLYFTFPERGEDLLALGCIADGVFNGYHYRHPEYAAYLHAVSQSFPGLQGGVRQNQEEDKLAPLEAAILSGNLTGGQFSQVLEEAKAEILLTKWQEAGLVAPQAEGKFVLTASGSWFVGEMMEEMSGLL